MDAIEYLRNRQSDLEKLSDEEFDRYDRAFYAAQVIVGAKANWCRSAVLLADGVAIQILELYPDGLPEVVNVAKTVEVVP